MPRNKYPEKTVEKILECAQKLFLEKGYENTTVIDIIKSTEMTRGAFYHHFKSKEDVFFAIIKDFSDKNPPVIPVEDDSLNGLTRLKLSLMNSLFGRSERKQLNYSAISLIDSPTFLKKLVIDTNRDVLVPLFQKMIDEGIVDGSITPQNSKLSAEILVMLFNLWFVPKIFNSNENENPQKIIMAKKMLDSIGLPLITDEDLIQLKSAYEKGEI